ncbi:MAG: Stk1 family PASTA domain-containing Ser/Thr kinase [Acetobacter sp.]|nr:Stk1 family PASTA domain-containing Ser/Thr kinase [Bacteroides sp.]MCM1340528.1 Stk1 family PASTA domain-containing Ser/Thr kinase [Acetobacter sp.]MCM1433268.1 Stk1 family PASTA domain-containing Ser/Thr kinase [Clostridiales bacterium]
MDNYVGKRLDGRYEIQEIIGVGGMSVVYKAYDSVDDRIVAVKVLKDEFLTNDDFVRRFKNESKAIALLSHPNIVKVYDVSFGEKLQYIVMEYVDGITLKEYIQKQQTITWNEALFFTTQILKALQHAHDKGIVHRDVKPQNIILLSNGDIKVADFGIARFSRSDTKTLTDSAIGSVHYISPEQAKGEFTDEKADIYSVGVVLYEMLTGSVPFEADNIVSVALMQVQKDAKRITDINPDVPVGIVQICEHAMQKNPNDRYQTAAEFLIDVEEIIKNPNTTFDYSCFVDKDPTKYVIKTNEDAALDDNDYDDYEDYEDYYDPKRKKKIITAVIVGLVFLIAAVVGLVMAVTGNVNTKSRMLENFVGCSYDEILSANTYDYQFIQEYEKSDSYEAGIVIRQEPEAGTKVLAGSQVKLIVSAALDDINVPNIYNLDSDKAKKALENEGLKNYKVTTVSSETVEEGKVVYSDPKAGSVVSADTLITIYLSSGPTTQIIENITVPDVVGLKQEGARAFLEKSGFTNISFVTKESPLPKGTALSQSPAAGASALADDTIKVTISSGVTTTTTKPVSKISLSVALPEITNDDGTYVSDTLIVELDGETYMSQSVSLKGGNANVSITVEGVDNVTIRVSLEECGNVDTQTVNPSKSKKIAIDFGTPVNSSIIPSTTKPAEEASE